MSMRKFLSPIEMSALKHEQEVFNSLLKRGEIDPKGILSTVQVPCGCGNERCCFISVARK